MKRDMDLVRDLLLKIEAKKDAELKDLLPANCTEEDSDNVIYHLGLLRGAGFIRASVYEMMTSAHWNNIELTWQGHDFLDSTRDGVVWKKTKAGIDKLGGASWEVIKGLAVAYAKQEAKTRLGLDL